jgi:acetylornithine aminotransferase
MPESTLPNPLTLEKESDIFFGTYARLPLHITHGEGAYLISHDGKKYLDMISGIGVNALGYANPALEKAIIAQTKKLIHASNLFMLEPQFELAEKLLSKTGMSRVFFSNSGTEAIEGAMKLARKWASGVSEKKRTILAMSNSFHGRTYGAVSLTAKTKYHEGFEPLLPETGFVAFNDPDDLESKVSDDTAAVFLECVQGEGGIYPANAEFIDKLQELRQKHNFLIVADEIQAGIGRTGTFFSYMNFNLEPDVVTSAKPLGGGLPLGAILGNARVSEGFEKGAHGTTFGGNPVACAAGLALINELDSRKILQNVQEIGTFFKQQLEGFKARFPEQISEVRQFGLMIGIEVKAEAAPYVEKAFQQQVLLNATNGNVIRLLPPLVVSQAQAQDCLDVLHNIFIEKQKDS